MTTEDRSPDEEVSPTQIEWPQSKGDPIRPCWSYAKKKGMYEAEALRMMAHDLVQRLKELELPLHRAMKDAAGDGLTAMAYIKMMTDRLHRPLLRLPQRLRRDQHQPRILGRAIRRPAAVDAVLQMLRHLAPVLDA